jgi:hypothetical protein
LGERLAKELTLFFGNRLDFSRIGSVAGQKGIFNYSEQEKKDRAYVLLGTAFTTACGYLLNQLLNPKEDNYATSFWLSTGFLVGFAGTHYQVIAPRLAAREHFRLEIAQSEKNILVIKRGLLEKLSPANRSRLEELIDSELVRIRALSLADEKGLQLTATLLKQMRATEELHQSLKTLSDAAHSEAYCIEQAETLIGQEVRTFGVG